MTNYSGYKDSQLQAFLDDYKQDAAKYGKVLPEVGLTMKFGHTMGNTVAYCAYIPLVSEGSIKVDLENWVTLTETQQKMLMYHEFSHCILRREHRNDLKSDKVCEASLMHKSKLTEECYKLYEDYYLRELFR